MLEPITAKSDKCNKSKEVKLFCHKIGTTLRILEGSTQWANKAEFCVRLSKEAVRKDMLDENPPIVFWDYCAERRALITNMTVKDLFQFQEQTSINHRQISILFACSRTLFWPCQEQWKCNGTMGSETEWTNCTKSNNAKIDT